MTEPPVRRQPAVAEPRAVEVDLADLAGLEPVRRLPGRNVTKAEIAVYQLGEVRIAVKTYRRRPAWVRHLLGRFLIHREAAAYRAAAGVDGLPRFFGCPDRFSLATEWIPGPSVPELPQKPVEDRVFEEVRRILDRLHARGIAIADLHHRNVLVTREGAVYLVDLAAAWLLPPRASRPRRALQRHFEELDGLALARMRARWTGGDIDAAVAAVGGSVVRWHRRGRKAKKFLDLLRGKRRRRSSGREETES